MPPAYAAAQFERSAAHYASLTTLCIEQDDLTRPEVHALLQEHLANMYELSPPEKVFAHDLNKLRVLEITFWPPSSRLWGAQGALAYAR